MRNFCRRNQCPEKCSPVPGFCNVWDREICVCDREIPEPEGSEPRSSKFGPKNWSLGVASLRNGNPEFQSAPWLGKMHLKCKSSQKFARILPPPSPRDPQMRRGTRMNCRSKSGKVLCFFEDKSTKNTVNVESIQFFMNACLQT